MPQSGTGAGGLRRLARVLRYRECREDLLHEWQRRWRGDVELPRETIRRVVVICHGNVCRSPFAGALLARLRGDLEVRSAGLSASEGKPVAPGALRSARRHEIELSRHGAHPLELADVAWADLIVGMQGRHRFEVARRWPEAAGRTVLLGDFLSHPPFGIEDPWGQPDAVFDATFERIREALEALRVRLPVATEGG